MRLRIRHRTIFRYDQPVTYAIQALRMMPRRHQGQAIEDWSVTVTGRRQLLVGYLDGFGNWVHLHSRNESHQETELVVSGIVELIDREGAVVGADEPLPPTYFLRQTALTRPDAGLAEIVAAIPAGRDLERLHRLMAAIGEAIACQATGSAVPRPAGDALAAGEGDCRDLAHAMAGCARALGLPARYVTGYLHDETGAGIAGHAWTEVYIADVGWVAVDAVRQALTRDRHLRVAVGLDYWSTAPVRGVWRGAADETQSETIQVAAAEMTQ